MVRKVNREIELQLNKLHSPQKRPSFLQDEVDTEFGVMPGEGSGKIKAKKK